MLWPPYARSCSIRAQEIISFLTPDVYLPANVLPSEAARPLGPRPCAVHFKRLAMLIPRSICSQLNIFSSPITNMEPGIGPLILLSQQDRRPCLGANVWALFRCV